MGMILTRDHSRQYWESQLCARLHSDREYSALQTIHPEQRQRLTVADRTRIRQVGGYLQILLCFPMSSEHDQRGARSLAQLALMQFKTPSLIYAANS
jgi:hypothetical protein